MYVTFDHQQTELLRELLQGTLDALRIETARTDSHDYREMLYERERRIAQLLAKISEESQPVLG